MPIDPEVIAYAKTLKWREWSQSEWKPSFGCHMLLLSNGIEFINTSDDDACVWAERVGEQDAWPTETAKREFVWLPPPDDLLARFKEHEFCVTINWGYENLAGNSMHLEAMPRKASARFWHVSGSSLRLALMRLAVAVGAAE